MKKLFLAAMVLVFLFGALLSSCGTIPKLATTTATNIGGSFSDAANKGEIGAEIAIKAWPYIDGMIQRAKKHGLDLTVNTNETISNLNRLAKKDISELTLREKGDIILSICIVEIEALKSGWDRYGVSIMKLMATF